MGSLHVGTLKYKGQKYGYAHTRRETSGSTFTVHAKSGSSAYKSISVSKGKKCAVNVSVVRCA